MCGIVGLCGNCGSREEQLSDLQKGLKGVEARGPYGTDTYVEEDLALGHAHLPIVRPGKNPQPLREGQNVITANHEVYNWRELSEKYGLEAANDTELLLRLVKKKGVEGLREADANFGFFGRINGEYVAARDKHGLFPLCYAEENGRVGFASESQALTNAGFSYRSLRIVPPGAYAKVRDGKAELKLWADVPSFEELGERKEVSPEEFREIVEQATSARIPEGDGKSPLVVALGGKDSSTLSYLVAKELRDRFLGCITVVHDGNPEGGDLPGARSVLEKYRRESGIHIPHHVEVLTTEYGEENIDRLLDVLGPSYPNLACALPEDLFARKARDLGAKVVMTAGGPDEALVGYPWVYMFPNRERNTDSLITQIGENEYVRNTWVLGRHGVENRAPFERILDACRKIPEYQKYRELPDGSFDTKLLLKQAIRGLIPDEVVDVKKLPVRETTGGGKVVEAIIRSDREYQEVKEKWEREVSATDWKPLTYSGSKGGFMGEGALYTLWRWSRRNPELYNLGATHFYGSAHQEPHDVKDVDARSRMIFANDWMAYGKIDQSRRKI